MATLVQRLPMIPRLTASSERAKTLAQYYDGWELLEVDESSGEILICKPCAVTSKYTKSKNLLILYGDAAVAWLRNLTVSA